MLVDRGLQYLPMPDESVHVHSIVNVQIVALSAWIYQRLVLVSRGVAYSYLETALTAKSDLKVSPITTL